MSKIKMKNKNIKIMFGFWIVFSLVFLIPLNVGSVYAETINQGNAQNTICGSVKITDSIILSILTLCLPGILEKLYEYKQIKCETARCYYDSVKNGLDPSFCSQHQAYKTCTYIVGEAFAIPPVSIIEYYRNAISQLLANPVGALWSGGVMIARDYMKTQGPACGTPWCGPTSLFLLTTDILGVVQQVKDMFQNGFFPPINPANSCDGLAEIKVEMQQIINAK